MSSALMRIDRSVPIRRSFLPRGTVTWSPFSLLRRVRWLPRCLTSTKPCSCNKRRTSFELRLGNFEVMEPPPGCWFPMCESRPRFLPHALAILQDAAQSLPLPLRSLRRRSRHTSRIPGETEQGLYTLPRVPAGARYGKSKTCLQYTTVCS